MRTRVFDGTDLDALEEHLREITPGLKIIAPQAHKPVFHVQSLFAEVGDLKVWRNSYGEGLGLTNLGQPDSFVIGVPVRGGLEAVQRRTDGAGQGQILSFLTREIERLMVRPDTKTDNLSIPVAALNARLAKLLDRPVRETLHFHPIADATEGAGAAVRSVLHGLLFAATSNNPRQSTAALRSLSTAMVDLLLESLPHNHTEALHRPPPRIGPRQVRRALAYIRDNPMPPLTTDELAAICGVSVRSLQYTFQAFVGVAPSDYWRRVRLERAIQEIKSEKPESLTRIAASWGFTNVTRFRALCAQLGFDIEGL